MFSSSIRILSGLKGEADDERVRESLEMKKKKNSLIST